MPLGLLGSPQRQLALLVSETMAGRAESKCGCVVLHILRLTAHELTDRLDDTASSATSLFHHHLDS